MRFVVLLAITTLAAAAADLRLVEAAKSGDIATMRALLTQHVDPNAAQADGATALAWASHRDDLQAADLLLAGGANVNTANDYGVTPLSLACLNGSAAMVQKLLKAGANPRTALPSGETPLMTASRSGNLETAKLVLSHDAEVNAKENRRGQTALMWAVAENHVDVVKALIEYHADVHARSKSGFTPLLFAAQQGNIEIAKLLLSAGADVNESNPEDGSALVVAASSGHELFASFLLQNHADPNVADGNGITPLHYAFLKGLARVGGVGDQPLLSHWYRPNMPDLAKALMSAGANPNARIVKFPPLPATRRINATSLVGATPFLLAAASYDVVSMRLLVANGADPLLTTKEKTTPLIFAAGLAEGLAYSQAREEDDTESLEAVKLAFELGGDVNAANAIGETAIHGAAYLGANRVIQFLVDKGAKVNAENKYGQTALSIAEYVIPARLTDRFLRPFSVHKSTAELLLKLGATPTRERPEAPTTKGSH